MKNIFPVILILLIAMQTAISQVIYHPKIDSTLNLVSPVSISRFDRELSGDTVTIVGGVPRTIYSRIYNSVMNPIAAQYIYEKFLSYGLSTRYQYNNATNINVIAKKTGTKYPNKQIIICAHYDDYCNTPPDTVPGADDNASGVSCVLEAARLTAGFNSEYTLLYIAFDEEEEGLYGSKAYSDSAFAHGDSIIAVFNLDMISYDGNNDNKFIIYVNPYSANLADDFLSANLLYSIGLNPIKTVNANHSSSDHWYFWQRGYKAFLGIEDDFNPYYHTDNDRFSAVNVPYFTKAVKNTLAMFMSWAMDYRIEISHNPVQSSMDTASKTVTLKYKSPVALGTGANAPRLYYRINNGSYIYSNAVLSAGDSLKFIIPGGPGPRKISYYFALQDSAGMTCVTLPSGGSGLNPPGTTAPLSPFVYYTFMNGNFCSATTPKQINDLQFTQDTIDISQIGNVDFVKLNLTLYHPDDGELFLTLRSMNNVQVTLSQYCGSGGANFINTTFDDSASVSILQGTPPFTGSFRPQNPLGTFKGGTLNGKWLLRIFDKKAGNTGTLANWCLLFRYYVSIPVLETSEPISYTLEQNYPNPFNPVTNIKFSVAKKESVTLKVFDALGREVRVLVSDVLIPGNYFASWNASGMSSGVYYYTLKSDSFNETRRMILLK